MAGIDPQVGAQILRSQLDPWHTAIENPSSAQEDVLKRFLKDYARTEYGLQHAAGSIATLADYRKAFPIITYATIKPVIEKVMAGQVNALLAEVPVGWAITRGTTQGESKFIPMTPTDLGMRISAGRAMLAYVAETGRFDLLDGVNLNLNFPSVVGTLQVGEQEVTYGYSSGIYTKYVSAFTPIRSVPSQDEIDALGGGKSRKDWDKRFELAYQLCKDQNVTLVGGVCPTAIRFARYTRKVHRVYPKDVWKT